MNYESSHLDLLLKRARTGRFPEAYVELESLILKEIRTAKTDPARVIYLRCLLGEVLQEAGQSAKARRQYHKVLKLHPCSIEAMLGIGNCYDRNCRLEMAKKWFMAAYAVAEEKHEHAKQLIALNALATNAGLNNNTGELVACLENMCHILENAPYMGDLYLPVAEWLIMANNDAVAIPFQECLIHHLVTLGYSRGPLCIAIRPYIEMLRRKGLSRDEISSEMDKFRSLAADETVANDLQIALERAADFRLPHYDRVSQELNQNCEADGI